ncbi:MAG: carbohydrate ABC transporter permease [Clostridiales bacterium]|nr:carbohydrate ABC transporter permease [Clostridiales bacterium]
MAQAQLLQKKNNKIRPCTQDRVFSAVVVISLVVFLLLTIYPLIFVISASFSDPKLVASGQMILFPKGFSLQGYQYVMQYEEIWLGYRNTIFYTIVGTLVNLVFTLPCAYGLSRRDVKGRNFIMTLYVITMYVGGGLIPHYLNLQSLHLINSPWVLIIPGAVSTYNLIVARTFFSNSIPWELHEAAFIDGSSDFRTFLQIVLPLSTPIIVVLTLYYGVGHWNSYFSALIYLNDRNLYPLQVFLHEILSLSNFMANAMQEGTLSPEEMAAMLEQVETANMIKYCMIVVASAPMMVLYPFLQRFFTKGVMIGAIKG